MNTNTLVHTQGLLPAIQELLPGAEQDFVCAIYTRIIEKSLEASN